jgi:hypothetical protein
MHMHAWVRRALVTTGTTAGIIALTAGSASAHFCYIKDLNDRAAANLGSTPAWLSMSDAVRMFVEPDMCDAGVAIIAAGGGVTPTTLINERGLMAGGNFKQGKSNPSIGHLDFAGLEAAIPGAYEACGLPMPEFPA